MIHLRYFLIAALCAAGLAPCARAQNERGAVPVADSSKARQLSREAHLQLESERPVSASPAVALLRIGEQIVLLSPGKAWLQPSGADARAIAGGRDLRDFGVCHDARFAYLAGGISSKGPSADVWRLSLNGDILKWTRIAVLPAPCVRPACAINGGEIFVLGGARTNAPFFVRVKTDGGTPEALALSPDLAGALSLGAQGDALYIAGRGITGTPGLWRWKAGAWVRLNDPPPDLLPLPPVAIGPAHLFYAAARKTAPLLSYHTITDTWTVLAGAEGAVAAMVQSKRGLVRAVETPGGGLSLRFETVLHDKKGLTALDYATLAGYFGLNLLIGFLCAKKKASSDDYFRGGGRIAWWALGISYMATGISSISLMAYPATAYASNWLLIGVPVFQSAAVVFTGFAFIRLFRRLNITTVFEYLEQRFGRAIRVLGGALMILGQIGGRLSIVMLLPSMAFSAVTGLNVYLSILLMGTVIVIYCFEGGMKAVVWTDVLQLSLMYGGMAIALVTIAHGVPGGFGGLLSEAHAQGKFKAFLFDWSFTQPTVWVFTCLAITTVFLQLGDQALMQRALSAPDEKAARNSVLLAGALILPIALMLFFIGTALFVFYRHQPAALDPALPNDSIFPYFVGNELPHGIVGLIMAGIFSAAMSAVSGSVNAISAIVVRDFLMPVRPKITEQARVRAARITTIVAGGLATGIAAIMATMDIRSLWETFAALIALIGGGFPGIFALGLLTRRANAPGVAIGLVASIGITFAIKHYTATNVFLFTSVAVGSCMVVGYVASLFFPRPTHSLDGLTVYALRRGREAD